MELGITPKNPGASNAPTLTGLITAWKAELPPRSGGEKILYQKAGKLITDGLSKTEGVANASTEDILAAGFRETLNRQMMQPTELEKRVSNALKQLAQFQVGVSKFIEFAETKKSTCL